MRISKMTIWLIAIAGLCVVISSKADAVTYDDGGTHWFDDLAYGMDVSNDTEVGMAGSIYGPLYVWDNSTVTISGWVDDLFPCDNSQVNITDGAYIKNNFRTRNNSEVSISDGYIETWFETKGYSQVTVSGGSLSPVCPIIATDNSTVTFYGTEFVIDGESFGYGELTSITGKEYNDEPLRHITGTLISGDSIDNNFYIGHDAKIILIPEPTSLLLFGLGGLFLRRRIA